MINICIIYIDINKVFRQSFAYSLQKVLSIQLFPCHNLASSCQFVAAYYAQSTTTNSASKAQKSVSNIIILCCCIQAQILVLGYHNTGTSMVTKLLLLLGAYGGSRKQLFIADNNKLKYMERWDVIETNHWVMKQYGQVSDIGSKDILILLNSISLDMI